jgi:hypothetical protein
MKQSLGFAALAAISGTLLAAISAHAQSTSLNSGSLGAAGNGTNAAGVLAQSPGAVGPSGGAAAYYSGGSIATPVNTTVPFNSALNPASTSPFTIEFWVNPATDVTDGSGPAPVFNRVSSGNRSGWVFFQRSAAQGWNFAMYNGSGSTVGLQVTGGTYTPGTWSLVDAVWDGTAPKLYVNGVDTLAPVSGPGGYNASTSAIFSVGSYDTGSNPFTGGVDETAFYGTALSAARILAHFNAASVPNASAYPIAVLADAPIEFLRNEVPEPSVALLTVFGLAGCGVLRRRGNGNRATARGEAALLQ